MATLSDARFEALRGLGYTGSTSDMLLAWLKDQASGPPGPSDVLTSFAAASDRDALYVRAATPISVTDVTGYHMRFMCYRSENGTGNQIGVTWLNRQVQEVANFNIQHTFAAFAPNSFRIPIDNISTNGIDFTTSLLNEWQFIELIQLAGSNVTRLYVNGVENGFPRAVTPPIDNSIVGLFGDGTPGFGKGFTQPYQWNGAEVIALSTGDSIQYAMDEGSGTTLANAGSVGGAGTITNENWAAPIEPPPAWVPIATPGTPITQAEVGAVFGTRAISPIGTVPDAWKQFLLLATGLPEENYHRNDYWFEYLGLQGHEGNMNDRELAFWLSFSEPPPVAGGGFSSGFSAGFNV